MKLLAIETATEACSVALLVNGILTTRSELAPRRHAELLLPMCDEVFAEAGIARSQLDAIAVGRGPGAFTGVRLAVSAAQGIALGLDRPIVAVSSLAALALDAPDNGAPILALIDARMGEVYAARWCRGADGGWTADVPVALYSPAALAEAIAQAPAPLAGNALTVQAEVLGPLAARLGLASWPAAVPGGAALAVLARAAQARGAWIDPALALPLYVRDKVAQTTAEREALRATAATVAAAGAA